VFVKMHAERPDVKSISEGPSATGDGVPSHLARQAAHLKEPDMTQAEMEAELVALRSELVAQAASARLVTSSGVGSD
jgi:hypothetical protein